MAYKYAEMALTAKNISDHLKKKGAGASVKTSTIPDSN